MKTIRGKNANGYWLMLAGAYGVTIGVATMTPMPWLLVVGGVFIVFPIVVGVFYGQIGRKFEHKLVTDSPAIVLTATAFAGGHAFARLPHRRVGRASPGLGHLHWYVPLPSPLRALPLERP